MNPSSVAVVIPVGSFDDMLERQVCAVLGQHCRFPFDIVLSVNSSEPDVMRAVGKLAASIGGERVQVVDSSDVAGAAHARNRGVRASNASRIAFCDADDRVHDGWLDALIEALDQFDAVSGSVIDVFTDARAAGWHPPATPGSLPRFLGREYVLTGNLAVRRAAFDAVGGFDESLSRCEDIAFGWALTNAGFTIGFADRAAIDYHHRAGVKAMLRQHFHFGRGMSEVLDRYGVPSGDGFAKADGWRAMKPNGQRAQRHTVGGTMRRGALASGRLSGIVRRPPSRAVTATGRSSGTRAREHLAPIAYLSAAYPAITHTFIQREVLALRALGRPVTTFAINDEDEYILTEVDRVEHANTTYLKSLHAATIARWTLSEAIRCPLPVWSTIRLAWRDVGADLGRGVKRTMQVGEGMLVARACRRAGITHIHAHMGQAPANVAWFASHFINAANPAKRATWSVTIHGPQDCLDEPRKLLARKIEAADFVVTVSDYTKAQLLWRAPAETWHKIHTIRCGIDLTIEFAAPRQRGEDPFRILIVARVSPEKGHSILLEAIAALRDRGHDVRLEIVGPGDFETAFGALAERLGVRDLVSTTSGISPSEVIERMRQSDVLCVPSFAEGLPVVIMEAAAVGLAVVATGISGIPELIEHDVTGLLTIPARHDLLADALERLLLDPELHARITRNARQRVEELHDETKNAVMLERLFLEVDQPSAPTSSGAPSES
jgi:colanic acid/amylovoran biosynthesis glycosyltransferase